MGEIDWEKSLDVFQLELDATLSTFAMIPFVGWVSTAGKAAKNTAKYGDEVIDGVKAVVKHGDEVVDAVTDVAKYSDEVVDIAVKGSSKVKIDLNIKPIVTNPKMQNIINDIYKGQQGTNIIENGTTMDAVRNELKTNLPTNGKFHFIKAQETINRLQRRLRAGDLTVDEIIIVNELINDLQDALNGN